ncbi:hypothetical protein SCHPADRAFT_888823 [Schizopora paradoxa]|uniref:Tubulin-specific chaperone A n=1 Tax=Schizopora paradoxa TaxID=27342 RepID=A0A0H2S006_9AGAM|nr:hypothetical protein SCHPADRAFT_888823 [Schizopora paradoxa]
MSAEVQRTKRSLKIQGDAVRRLNKELESYQNEVSDLSVKLGKQVESAEDKYDIKNTERMIDESKKMVKVTKESLANKNLELRELVTRVKNEEAGKEGSELMYSEELKKATEILEMVNT